jgi:hypothetical protein
MSNSKRPYGLTCSQINGANFAFGDARHVSSTPMTDMFGAEDHAIAYGGDTTVGSRPSVTVLRTLTQLDGLVKLHGLAVRKAVARMPCTKTLLKSP